MNELIAIVVSIVFGFFALVVGKRKFDNADTKASEPPENKVADAAMDAVQETFTKELNQIKSATTGDSAASDLADLGNARRR